MLRERNQSFKAILVTLDFLISLKSFALAFSIRYFFTPDGFVLDPVNYLFLGIFVSFTVTIVFSRLELYHPKRGIAFLSEISTIIMGSVMNLFLVVGLLFFIRSESFSRLVMIYYLSIQIILTTISHYLLRIGLKYLRKKGYNLKTVIILGLNSNSIKFASNLKNHTIYGYKVEGFIFDSNNNESNLPEGFVSLGHYENMKEIFLKYKPNLVVYALSPKEGNYLTQSIDLCDTEGIEIKVIPGYEEYLTSKGRIEMIDGIPVITIRNLPLQSIRNRIFKRIFDILFSLSFMILFSPVYITIMIIIKLTSRGPIFYKQERVGVDRKHFQMLKFRSMVVQDPNQSSTLHTAQNDKRVTWIGKYLRKSSLDEIPQFINVLLGDMTVVGPRPEMTFFVNKFKNEYSHYMRRHSVKGGITGYAQILGWRGDTSIEKRVEADIYYIENWSFLLDIKIIILTPFKGFFNENAY